MTDKENSQLPKLTLPLNATFDRDSKNFAQRLRDMRSHLGLTLKALSLVTKVVDPDSQGISTVSLSRYEGGAEPGLRELKLLSYAFYKPVAWLIYGDQDDPFHWNQSELVNLDMLFLDMVHDTVNQILEKRGLIEPDKTIDLRNREQYDAMIETVKKLAK